MMAGMCCALGSPGEEGPRTSPADTERPPCLRQSRQQNPPGAKGQRRKWVNPLPGHDSTQHTPAALLGAVG